MTPEMILWGLGGLAVVLLLIRFIALKKPQIPGGPDIGTSMTIGGREVQEDQVETLYTPSGLLAVLADGMGKEYGGRLASRAAVETFLDLFKDYNAFDNPQYYFRKAFNAANRAILRILDNERRGSASVGAVIVRDGWLYDKAEEQYIAAQLLAGNIHFTEGRDSAISALERLYESMRQEQADNEEAAQQASEAQSAAASILSEGDTAFTSGDYTSALTYYTTALQKYIELEDEAQTAALQIKIAATEEKQAEQQALAAEAEEYMALAEDAYAEKNYVQAKKYYLLARDVYSVMQNDEKVAEVSRRMELVEMGISAEEEAAREAEEAARRAEEEAAQQAEEEQPEQNAEESVSEGQESVSPDAVG